MRNALAGIVCLLLLVFSSNLTGGDTAWEKEIRKKRDVALDHFGKGDWVKANAMWKSCLVDAQKKLDRKEMKLDDLTQSQARLLAEMGLRLMYIANWRNDDYDEKDYRKAFNTYSVAERKAVKKAGGDVAKWTAQYNQWKELVKTSTYQMLKKAK